MLCFDRGVWINTGSSSRDATTPLMSERDPSAVRRTLAAVLSADVQGDSRLMGDDEVATIRTLAAYRELMVRTIQRHTGRVVDSPGDNLLAEFLSGVDAVQCAVEIQMELALRNAEIPVERQLHYRMGIDVGDVVVEERHIDGDGVNIAARLASLAERGGICISGAVHAQIADKLNLTFTYHGEQRVKHIANPIQVYQVHWEAADRAPLTLASDLRPLEPSPPGPGSQIILGLVILVILGLGTFALKDWYPLLSSPAFWHPPRLPLPDKPSIAVLPFTNMSGDPEQEYFSDGITGDIIADLSKISGLFVIAHNSSLAYKGRAVDVEQVGHDLGVRYVLEGSVRWVSDRVRLNAQLLDTTTGGHVWTERYDGKTQDIFVLQDQITQQIVQALHITLTADEQARLVQKSTDNLQAYNFVLRGKSDLWRTTPESMVQARHLFQRAIALDAQYASAYAWLGWADFIGVVMQWEQDSQIPLRAHTLGQRAVALDDSLPVAHRLLGYIYLFEKQYARAISALERAVALAPNDADSYAWFGNALTFAGRPQDALRLIRQAIRLNPRYPFLYLYFLGHTYRMLGQLEEAAAVLKRTLAHNPDFLPAYYNLLLASVELGRIDESRALATKILRLSPNFSVTTVNQVLPYKDPASLERVMAAFREAGLEGNPRN